MGDRVRRNTHDGECHQLLGRRFARQPGATQPSSVCLQADLDLRQSLGMRPFIPTVLLVVSFLAACGGAELGESCDSAGSTDECVDHAACTNEEGDSSRCRALCEEKEECPSGYSCNGVSGTSRKTCQPDK